MLKTLFFLILAGAIQTPVDAFKKEMEPLQAMTDKAITETASRVMSTSRAAIIEGYGVVVIVGVAFEPPQNALFPSAVNKAELLANVARRQKDIKDKVTALIKQRVTSMEALGADDSLTIVVQLENYHPNILTNLPKELVFSVKKAAPQVVTYKEI
jgi:hypothetical protein